MKIKELTFITLLFILGAVILNLAYEQKSELQVFDNDDIQLRMIPDTISVEGDRVTFEALESETKEKVIVNYQLKNPDEQQLFLDLFKTTEIAGKASTKTIPKVRNLNGFNYERFLDFKGISQKISLTEIKMMNTVPVSYFHPIKKTREYRRRAVVYSSRRFPALLGDYMNALLFGYKNNEPESFQQTWQQLGVAHLFSLSGMHIYFFIMIFEFIILFMGTTKETLYYLTLIFIFLLVIMTGLGSGMVRAGLQRVIKQTNEKYQWHLSALDCWSLALFINCLFNPYILFTIGGQLTYYLTFFIIIINPLMKKQTSLVKPWLFSFVISWLSLPLIWYHFYEWNFLNFFLTVIMSPIIFLLLLPCLAISFVLGILFQDLSFEKIERIFLFFQSLAEKGAKQEIFIQVTGKIPLTLLLVGIAIQWLWLIEWEKTNLIWSRKMCCFIFLSFTVSCWKYVNPRGMIAFVDVGQGDCLFLQLPFHRGNYLLDTGGRLGYEKDDWQRSSDKREADYTVIPLMKSFGVKKLDGVFISHAHEDHFGDLDRISDNVVITNLFFGEGSYCQNNFQQILAYNGLKRTTKKIISAQTSWKKQGLTAQCLYPFEKGDGQNNDSLVMKLKIKDKAFLLMGDLEKEGENTLLAQSPSVLEADILKAGHHGSKTSSQSLFLKTVNPQVAVISCGNNNRYGHPSPETLTHLEEEKIKTFRTDQDGMIYYNWSLFSKKLSVPKYIKD